MLLQLLLKCWNAKLEILLGLSIISLIVQLNWPWVLNNVVNRPRPGYLAHQHPEMGYSYLLHLPVEYHRAEKVPVLLYLHGSGERGKGLGALVPATPFQEVKRRDVPVLFVAPNCPADQRWDPVKLNALLSELETRFAIDRDRVYVAGFSMGGFGATELVESAPKRFAALLALAGCTLPQKPENFVQCPSWLFHGTEDSTVPMSVSEKWYEAVNKAGGSPQFSRLPNRGHGILKEVFGRNDVWQWMLGQCRTDLPVLDGDSSEPVQTESGRMAPEL